MTMYEKDAQDLKKAFRQHFGDLTWQKVLILIKLVQHCRTYCRSNAALKSFLNWFFAPNLRVTDGKVQYHDRETGERREVNALSFTMNDKNGKPITVQAHTLDHLNRSQSDGSD